MLRGEAGSSNTGARWYDPARGGEAPAPVPTAQRHGGPGTWLSPVGDHGPQPEDMTHHMHNTAHNAQERVPRISHNNGKCSRHETQQMMATRLRRRLDKKPLLDAARTVDNYTSHATANTVLQYQHREPVPTNHGGLIMIREELWDAVLQTPHSVNVSSCECHVSAIHLSCGWLKAHRAKNQHCMLTRNRDDQDNGR